MPASKSHFVKHTLTSGPPVGPAERRRAVHQVVAHADNPAECRELLDMLGLGETAQAMRDARYAA